MQHFGIKQKGYIKKALGTALLTALVFTAFVYSVVKYQAAQQMSDLKAAEQAKAKLSAALLEQSFKYTANDLLAISKLPAVKRFNRDRSELGKDWLEQVFRAQLEQKIVYQQLRFLDSEGVELSRLERRSKQVLATPEQDLQAKGDRYYFRDTRTLDEGEVYIC